MKVFVILLVFLCNVLMFFPVQGTTCHDTLDVKSCKRLAKHKACFTHPERMSKLCQRTCKFCFTKTSCNTIRCSQRKKCYVAVNLKATCRCLLTCRQNQQTGYLCGRNGKTYENLCALRRDECNLNKNIIVQHYGKCIIKESCIDASASDCQHFKKNRFCEKQKRMMQFYCAKTCRLCRQPAPLPSCSTSTYGCCWNSDEAARGENQEGCQVCKDRKFCKQFIPICGKDKNRAIMRQLCPVSCGYC